MISTKSAVWAVAVCLVSVSSAFTASAEAWTVTLTKKQAKAQAEMAQHKDHSAFAISPDGSWGRSWGYSTKDEAKQIALGHCRTHLKKGKRDCVIYQINGKRNLPETTEVNRISKLYKVGNGKSAAAFFGRANISFSGNRPAALASWNRIEEIQGVYPGMQKDTGLKRRLTGLTVMNQKTAGFGVWLGAKGAEHFALTSKRKILRARYKSWFVTQDGLLCLENGKYTTGSRTVGLKCLRLSDIASGSGTMSWDGAQNKYKMQLIAGDGRFGAVK